MRRINSDFQTLHISEEGQKLSNRDYFGYVEMDDFACYVLADSLDDEPAVNSARLVVDSIIRDFTEAPTMGKGTLRRYLLRAHTELLKQRAGMHLKVAVVVAVTDYRTLRYCHVGNSRLYLIRNARILEQTKDQSLTQNLLEQERILLDEAARHEERNNLYSFLGERGKPEIQISRKKKLEAGDLLIQLTRGVWEQCGEQELLRIVNDAKETKDILDQVEDCILMEQNSRSMKEILRAVEEEGAFRLMKVMLRCDFLEQQKLLALQPVFEGVIETEEPEKEWKVEIRLRENREYLKKIEYLYLLFTRNGIPWQTANAPYLYKMADMIVTGLPEGITGKEKIRRVTIQFGEYSSMIQEDVIPVWNIQRLELDSIGFPIPCGDHQNYEHSVSLKKHGINHAYLVEDDRNVQSVSQEGERLRIVCKTGEAKKWGIYQIRSSQEQKIDRYTFPIMGNGREENFAEKYQRKWNQQIRTKTELAHFIKGFGLEDYVRYQDCQVEDDFPGNRETYAVNCFIPDEIRLRSTQKKLVLYFQPGKQERWLQRDILSFLVSEVQRIYPEYDCGGILV